MNLRLKRTFFGETFTIGNLFVDDALVCFTLEDKVRQVDGVPVSEWKVPHVTAIPTGTYPVSITFSNRFQTPLPLLSNVEGFEGIRIHTGNTDADTDGCILVGTSWDGRSDFIGGSRAAFAKLFPMLQSAEQPISIVVS